MHGWRRKAFRGKLHAPAEMVCTGVSDGLPEGSAVRIASVGYAVFVATMIALGILGLVHGDFAAIWPPVSKAWPARHLLAYLCGIVPLGCGIGLLWPRAAPLAARVLLAWLVLWLLVFRLPLIVGSPISQDAWSGSGETAVILVGAWALYVGFATDWDRRWLGFASGAAGMRKARALYALALLVFGVAHFRFLKETAALVPGWLPAPMVWAALTGAAYIVAGMALLMGLRVRLAAVLCAWQMGLFTLLVWVPAVLAGANAFQWSEAVISWTLTAGAWVFADACSAAWPRYPVVDVPSKTA